MRDVSELAKRGKHPTTAEQDKQKEWSFEEMMKEIMRADMAMMLKESRENNTLVYPESIKPLWKN